MQKPRYFRWIFLAEAVGITAGILSRQGMLAYEQMVSKPALTPPGIVFAVVWTVLYGLMGISAARVAAAQESRDRSRGLNLFVLQLTVNFFWSLIFFNAQSFGLALAWLAVMWALILAMTAVFRRVDRTAALLQVPYLLWVTFAAYLNYGVWMLNR